MRKRIWTGLICSIFMIAWGISLTWAGEFTGRQIIEEQHDRHIADNESSVVNLTLLDRKGKEKHQKMALYTGKKEGKTRTLIQYHAPANIRGVGLLTWEQGKDKDDDQWLYMSAARSTKRIAGGSKHPQVFPCGGRRSLW